MNATIINIIEMGIMKAIGIFVFQFVIQILKKVVAALMVHASHPILANVLKDLN